MECWLLGTTPWTTNPLKCVCREPWIVQTWCVPPKVDAEYVWRMEDVIQTYLRPYDPAYPVVCFDEACKQLFGEVRPVLPMRPGSPAKQDYEYERKGVCNQRMTCEPLRGSGDTSR